MMLIFAVIWIVGVAFATYLFNFDAPTRFLALALVMAPPLLGVTLVTLGRGTADANMDATHVIWWAWIAVVMVGLSLTISVFEIMRLRLAETRAHHGA